MYRVRSRRELVVVKQLSNEVWWSCRAHGKDRDGHIQHADGKKIGSADQNLLEPLYNDNKKSFYSTCYTLQVRNWLPNTSITYLFTKLSCSWVFFSYFHSDFESNFDQFFINTVILRKSFFSWIFFPFLGKGSCNDGEK